MYTIQATSPKYGYTEIKPYQSQEKAKTAFNILCKSNGIIFDANGCLKPCFKVKNEDIEIAFETENSMFETIAKITKP